MGTGNMIQPSIFEAVPFLPPLPVESKPPSRERLAQKKSQGGFIHFALTRCYLYPPPRRKPRQSLQIDRIDVKRFVASKILPYPEWPLICRATLLPSFDTEKDSKSWLAKFFMDSQLKRIWKCGFCRMFHHECYPIEASGNSSGKSFRKNDTHE